MGAGPPNRNPRLCIPDRLTVQPLLSPALAASRERLKEYLRADLLDDRFIRGVVDSDLEVKVGFQRTH